MCPPRRFAIYAKSINPVTTDAAIEKAYLALSRGDPKRIPGNALLYQTFIDYSLVPSFYTYVTDMGTPGSGQL